MIPDIPDVFALIGFALSILGVCIWWGHEPKEEEA